MQFTIGWLVTLGLVPYLMAGPTDPREQVRKVAAEALTSGKLSEAIEQVEALLRTEPLRTRQDYERASILNSLGSLYYDADRLPEAERCYREALRIHKSAGTPDKSLVALLTNFAALRTLQGRFTEAQKLYKDAENVAMAVFGATSPEIVIVWNGLTDALLGGGQSREALIVAERALAVVENSTDHPVAATTLSMLAQICYSQGRKPQAGDYARRALAKWNAGVGVDHPSYAGALATLAVLLSDGRPQEATALFKQALETLVRTLGPGHSYYGSTMLLYARHLKSQRQKAEAQEMTRLGESILKAQHHRNALNTTVDIQSLKAPMAPNERNVP